MNPPDFVVKAKISGFITVLALMGTGCGKPNSASKTKEGDIWAYQGQVVTCSDGDTCNIRLEEDDAIMKVRLIGIDAPEVTHGPGTEGQPMGNESRVHINALIKGKNVKVLAINEDRYGRTLGEIYLGNKLVNVDMLKQGLAESYIWSEDEINAKSYKSAEYKAKTSELGIWSLNDYESPEDFRRRMKEE